MKMFAPLKRLELYLLCLEVKMNQVRSKGIFFILINLGFQEEF